MQMMEINKFIFTSWLEHEYPAELVLPFFHVVEVVLRTPFIAGVLGGALTGAAGFSILDIGLINTASAVLV